MVGVAEREVLNLCANNYLGLADHPDVLAAAREAVDRWGYGMASVRFICGTQEVHKELEAALTDFLGTEDTILYSSCFDANGGIFEALLDERDAVISDALNHASIIDGIRLCKAQRFRYANRDMEDLERQLKESAGARFRMVVTDGVFSMDGYMAPLPEICRLAERYEAMVMGDDSYDVGFNGANGRGTPEHHGVMGRIDAITGTLGKALGGASGGYVSGRKELVAMLRQRSRPYLFSNSVAPPIAAASLKVLELLRSAGDLRRRLTENTRRFRARMTEERFDILPGEHPIVPVMVGDAALAGRMAAAMLEKGVYVIGFSYPVVPQGKARIRTQVSAAHSPDDLERAHEAGLVYTTDDEPGLRRARKGKGFVYLDPDGRLIRDGATLDRIRSIVIPPAWEHVWITIHPRGHLQATGRDARGRKQHRYHPRWREIRDVNKFDRMAGFAKVLPRIRRQVSRDMSRDGLPKQKVVATIVRLLETTFIRVGNEEYAKQNRSFGLTTLRNRHVDVKGSTVRFLFHGKSGVEVQVGFTDRRVARVIKRCEELPGQKLFQYIDAEGEHRTVSSDDVNQYLRDVTGEDFTAKDFRTWAGTVLAASALREGAGFESETDAKRNVVAAIDQVARKLGHTRAVCRRSYVHPAVIDTYMDGRLETVLGAAASRVPARPKSDEAAVLALVRRKAKRIGSLLAA